MSEVKDEASGFGDFLGGRGGHSFCFENEGHFPLGPAAELGTVGAAGARGISSGGDGSSRGGRGPCVPRNRVKTFYVPTLCPSLGEFP